ncbi:MAG: PD40 domain-containing protein, partial [Solirubrobacteraceae bacterium]|nr:PD40 domain-containing protein [Solirubrobacteraceae bacterium]
MGTNALTKIYLQDLAGGSMTLVSGPEGQPGVLADESAALPTISGDGRWIAFQSAATNLIPGYVKGNAVSETDVYLYEVATGDLTLVSHSTSGALTGGSGNSDSPSLSHDGRYLVWSSTSTDLVAGFADGNGLSAYDVYVFDRVAGTTRLVTRSPASATTSLNGGAGDASISPDGRYVVVATNASDAVSYTDNNGASPDLFLTPIATGDYQLISHVPGAPTVGGNGQSGTVFGSRPASWLAGKVAFRSTATDLVSGFSDQNATGADTYVWDRGSGTTKLVSHANLSATRGGNGTTSGTVGVSADGSVVVHDNTSVTLTPGAVGGFGAVYAYDVATGDNSLASHALSSLNLGPDNASSSGVASADGRFIAYLSLASNLVSPFADNNTTPAADAFIVDRTGSPAPASQTPPVVTGTVALGQMLACEPGKWSEFPALTFSWHRGNTQVATGQTYV